MQAGIIDLGLSIPRQLPADGRGRDPIDWLVEEMDRFGIERGMLACEPRSLEALRRHPRRFFLAYEADANRGMDEVRRIHELHARHAIRAVSASPSLLCPQVPIDDRRWYPIYAACVELDLTFVCSVGVPQALVPFAAQHVERVDEPCWFFPELRFVMRDGAEPWTELAMLLVAKWPNLFFMSNGRAPADYPAAWLELANSRAPDKLLFASGPGPTLEACAKQLPELDLRPAPARKFLRDNALRVFRLP
jgi:predicted TIM-barrel fold metal-dependent hydrolase